MDEEIVERPPHTRLMLIHEYEILDGSIRSWTPPPVTQPCKHDLGNLTDVEKISGEIFSVWKLQMCILLHAQKTLGIVDGSTMRESFADEEDWLDKDTCYTFLISTIDNKLMHRLMNWRRLCTIHKHKTGQTKASRVWGRGRT